MQIRVVGRMALVMTVAMLVASAGCTDGFLESSLNPQFLSVIGTPISPVAPGTSPYVIARVINTTQATVVFSLSWLSSGAESSLTWTAVVQSGGDSSFVIACPVEIITLGDAENAQATGASIVFDDNTRQEIPSMPRPLVGETISSTPDFYCGDVVVFAAYEDSSRVGGYGLASGVVDGSQQPTEFSGPDTFSLLERETAELVSLGLTPLDVAWAAMDDN